MFVSMAFAVQNLRLYILIQTGKQKFRFKHTGFVIFIGDILMVMGVFIIIHMVFFTEFHHKTGSASTMVVMRHGRINQ